MDFKIAVRAVYLFLLLAILHVCASLSTSPLRSLSPTVSGIRIGEPKDEAIAGRACGAYVAASGADAAECSDPKGDLFLAFGGPGDRPVVSYVSLEVPLPSQDACDEVLEARYGLDSRGRSSTEIRLDGVGAVRLSASWIPGTDGGRCSISADCPAHPSPRIPRWPRSSRFPFPATSPRI